MREKIKDRIHHVRQRVLHGQSPDKIMDMEIEKALAKEKPKDIFSIHRHKWKDID